VPARQQKSRATRRSGKSGRVTPKGTTTSGRYTPPIPRSERVSPKWMPFLIVGLLIAGVLVIVINYLGILPGGASNWYLLLGLGLIVGGFVTATNLH